MKNPYNNLYSKPRFSLYYIVVIITLSVLFGLCGTSCSKKSDPAPEKRCQIGHRLDVSTGIWEHVNLGCFTKTQFDNDPKPGGKYYTDFTWEKCDTCK